MNDREWQGFKISLEEVEEGFRVLIKGDKEVLRPKLEAMEAWLNYHEKAHAAGWHAGFKPWHNWMGAHGWITGHGWAGRHRWGHGHRMAGPEKVKKFMGHFQQAFKNAVDEIKDEKK